MKRFFDISEGEKKSQNYDPVMRRFGIEPDFSFMDKLTEKPSKNKKEEISRISKQEDDVKNGKYVSKKKRANSKSPFSKHQHDSSNERKEADRFNSKLKDTIMGRHNKDLEEEIKYLKYIVREINDILINDDASNSKNQEEYFKNKLGKIENIIKSVDEDLPSKKQN